jgi:hypothetical protein
VKIGKAGRAVRLGRLRGLGELGRNEKIRKARRAMRGWGDRMWVEYFSEFGKVIRCLYFGDCSVILRSS